MTRVYRLRPAEVCNRLLAAAECPVCEAPVVIMGEVGARIEPDSLTVVGDGAVVVARGPVRDAAVVMGERVARIEPDGLGEVGDGTVVVALGHVCVASVVVGM